MIDLHCHIMPFIDDGAENAEIACEMAKHCLRSGVDTVVATPHCNLFGARDNFAGRSYEECFGMFRALLHQHRIPLTVLPGAELFAHSSNLGQILDERKVVTLNRSRYLLTEFNFRSHPDAINTSLERITRRGYVPVIAHPERYSAVQENPSLAAQWFGKGYIIQLNKGSLLGRLGIGSRDCSLALLRAGLAHVIASDAHNMDTRPTGFLSLIPFLQKYCPAEYIHLLLQENPAHIIADEPIPIINYD